MSEYLTTHLTNVLPKILIIGEVSDFSQQMCQLFQKKSFNVDFFDFSNNALSTQQLQKLQKNTYYKIVVLFNLLGKTPNVQPLIKILLMRKEPLLIFARFDTLIDVDSSTTRTWLQAVQEQYENIIALEQALPKASLILARDLMLTEFYHPAHSYFFYYLNNKQLLNPQLNFSFMSQKSFLMQTQNFFFAPYDGSKILIEAQALPSAKYFGRLNHFFDHQCQIINQSLLSPDYNFPFTIKKITLQADLDFIDESYLKEIRKQYPALKPPKPKKPAPVKKETPVLDSTWSQVSFAHSPLDGLSPEENILLKSSLEQEQAHQKFKKRQFDAKQEAFLLKYEQFRLTVGQTECRPYCNLSNFNFVKNANLPVTIEVDFLPQMQSNVVLTQNLKKITTPAILKDHFNHLSLDDKKPSPFLYYQALSHMARSTIKCHPRCDLQNFNFVKIYPRLEKPEEIILVPPNKPIKLSAPPLPPSPSATESFVTTADLMVIKKEKTKNKTQNFVKKIIFSPQSFIYKSQKEEINKKIGKQKPSAPLAMKAEKPFTTKKKSQKNKVLAKIDQLLAESVLVQKIRQKQRIVLSATAAGLTSLIIFVFLFLPYRNKSFNQTNLQRYFASCQESQVCFRQLNLSKVYTLAFINTEENQVFTNDLYNYINKNIRLEKQIQSYVDVAWQRQAGDALGELKVINQLLTPLIEAGNNLQTKFFDQKESLALFVPETEMENFIKVLTHNQQKLLTLKKILPFLDQLSQEPDLNMALFLMDDRYPRMAGGLLTGVASFKLNHGSSTQPQYYAINQIESNPIIKVATPSALLTSNFFHQSGLANLGFNRSFNETGALSAQVLDKALNLQPDVVIGLSLENLIELKNIILQKNSTSIQSDLNKDLMGKSSIEVEQKLIFYLSQFFDDLEKIDAETKLALFYTLMQQLDRSALQIYSQQDKIAPLISQLNLNNDLNNIMCPSNLPSDTCYLDSLAQNDNYMHQQQNLTQEITHHIQLKPEETVHTRTIVYDNTLSNETARTYLSFILPYGSTIRSFTVNDKNQALDEYNGATISIKAGESSVVVLEFYLTRPIEKNNFTYSFYNQYQPGLAKQNLRVAVENNLPYNPKVIAPSAISEQKKIIFSLKEKQSFHGAIVF